MGRSFKMPRVSFRTKMAAVVAPLFVAAIAMTLLAIKPQLDHAHRASETRRQVFISQTSMQLIDEIATERALSAWFTGSPGSAADQLRQQRATTDERAQALQPLIDDARALLISDHVVDRVVRGLDDLGELRARIDEQAISTTDASDRFTSTIATLIAFNTTLASEARDPSMAPRATSVLSFTRAKEFTAQQQSLVLQRLSEGSFQPLDYGALVSLHDAIDRGLTAYRESLPGDEARSFATLLDGSATRTAESMFDRVLEDARLLRLPTVDPQAWFSAQQAQLDATDVEEDGAFQGLVDAGQAVEDRARATVLRYLVAASLAILVAVGLVFALGRTLVRRIRTVSQRAYALATDQLPRVLDRLRNPTSEALASNLPELEADAHDEIGSLASSFNTVVRRSVQTSLEHSQRRSATLTTLLASLGRRNQALIERQIELIDGLEARYDDPDLLSDLFQLDHMITRMRRNAENLLVLASEQPARKWSDAVMLFDVVRAATSEASDLSRIRVELPPGAGRVAGRHAVDMSHLFAELIENATAYSPPGAPVFVRGQDTPTGFQVWIVDSGIGMSDEALVEANRLLIEPPDVDELTAERVGFHVAARLARRLGASIRLQSNPGGGLAAAVVLPSSVFELEPVHGFVTSTALPARDGLRSRPEPVATMAAADAAVRSTTITSPLPLLTADGLESRVPGATFAQNDIVDAFETGALRRLPLSTQHADLDARAMARRRMESAGAFRHGVTEANAPIRSAMNALERPAPLDSPPTAEETP